MTTTATTEPQTITAGEHTVYVFPATPGDSWRVVATDGTGQVVRRLAVPQGEESAIALAGRWAAELCDLEELAELAHELEAQQDHELEGEQGPGARLELAGQAHSEAREALARAREELRGAVLASLAEGLPETQAARLAGVDRMTVRSWRAKASEQG